MGHMNRSDIRWWDYRFVKNTELVRCTVEAVTKKKNVFQATWRRELTITDINCEDFVKCRLDGENSGASLGHINC